MIVCASRVLSRRGRRRRRQRLQQKKEMKVEEAECGAAVSRLLGQAGTARSPALVQAQDTRADIDNYSDMGYK